MIKLLNPTTGETHTEEELIARGETELHKYQEVREFEGETV